MFNALVFDMEFYSGLSILHIHTHKLVRRYSLVWMYVQKRVYTRSLCISLNAFHLFLLNLCIDFVSELYRIGDKVKFVGDPACSNYNRTKTEHTSHEALINPYSFAFV